MQDKLVDAEKIYVDSMTGYCLIAYQSPTLASSRTLSICWHTCAVSQGALRDFRIRQLNSHILFHGISHSLKTVYPLKRRGLCSINKWTLALS